MNDIKEKNTLINNKGVYELGSIFKTFTVALALEHDLWTQIQLFKTYQEKLDALCMKSPI